MANQSKRTDAILAAYEEAHGHFMMSFLIAAELAPDLNTSGSVKHSTWIMPSRNACSG